MKLFVYDHCPYCVKARMVFGIRKIPFELITLLNDDVETPTNMVGKKMVPILEKDDGSYMPESMDIVRLLDASTPVFSRETTAAMTEWLEASQAYLYALVMPRWVKAPLEEFATQPARDYFIHKKEAYIGSFEEHMAKSAAYIAQANEHLLVLDHLIKAPDAVHGVLSEDDIHVFAVLRSLSIVKGIDYPPAVETYRQRMADMSSIPLHDEIAL